MHYPLDAYSKNGQPTLAVNNDNRYKKQGSPTIGHRPHLSPGDIRQVNKMYKCYNPSGDWGRLRVHVKKATGLRVFGRDIYCIKITAYHTDGKETYTSRQGVFTYPDEFSWENVFIAKSYYQHWRYFEIRIMYGWRDVISRQQTIWVKPPGVPMNDSYCMADGNHNICVYLYYKVY